MTKLRLRWHRVSLPAPTLQRFGALTPTGTGGVPTTGSSIVTGDSSGHFQVSGGFVTPSPAGVAAGLNLAPYALVFDDASTMTINVDANAWDVRTQAEWDTAITQSTANLSGKTIFVRPDGYRGGGSIVTGVDGGSTAPTRLRRADFGGLTIEGRSSAIDGSVFPPVRSADPCTVNKFVFRGTRNVTLRKLATTRVAENKIQLITEAANACYGITIDHCHISGAVGDPQGDYSTSTTYPNWGIDLVSFSNSGTGLAGGPTITNNVVEWGDSLVSTFADRSGDNTITLTGNFLRYAYHDCMKASGGNTAAVTVNVSDNYCTDPIGLASDSENPHKDAFQFGGTTSIAFDITINFNRNRIIGGSSRGRSMQGLYLSDLTSTDGSVDSGHFYIVTAEGNLYIGDHVNALVIDQAKNCVLRNNTLVNKDTGNPVGNQVSLSIGFNTSSGTHTVERNVADAINLNGRTVTTNDNIILGKQGATISYGTAFVGPTFAGIVSLPTIMSTYSLKPSGPLDLGTVPDVGAIGSAAIAWASSVPGSDGVTLVP